VQVKFNDLQSFILTEELDPHPSSLKSLEETSSPLLEILPEHGSSQRFSHEIYLETHYRTRHASKDTMKVRPAHTGY
jgi:hypothetical protein